jgi:hypothetical protein
MAQALTVTVLQGNPMMDAYAGDIVQHAAPVEVKCYWTSDSSGDLSKNVASTFSEAQVGQNDPRPAKLRGFLARVVCIPDGTTTQPSAAYDVYLKDPNGIDVANGLLIDRSNSAADQWVPTTTVWVDYDINLVVDAAGDSKRGQVILHLIP